MPRKTLPANESTLVPQVGHLGRSFDSLLHLSKHGGWKGWPQGAQMPMGSDRERASRQMAQSIMRFASSSSSSSSRLGFASCFAVGGFLPLAGLFLLEVRCPRSAARERGMRWQDWEGGGARLRIKLLRSASFTGRGGGVDQQTARNEED